MKTNKKVPISIRVSSQVLDWFRGVQPRGYQSLMHAVLEQYVENQIEAKTWLAGRAQEIFRKYYAQCFWHYDKNLKIGPDNINLIIDGLKKFGGREGLRLAEELCQ